MISELLVNIANKIKSIKDGVAAVYAAISSKGGTLPEEQTLANLPSTIDGMQQTHSSMVELTATENNKEYLPADYGVDGFSKVTTDVNLQIPNAVKVASFTVTENCVSDDGNWYGEGIDTSEVTSLANTFMNNNKLVYAEISSWDTSNVSSMSAMFFRCRNLQRIDVSNWNTSKVTSIGSMFQDCESLQVLDISNWDFSNINNVSQAFQTCKTLQKLDLKNLVSNKVNSLFYLFSYCTSLKWLDITGWNVSNVTDYTSFLYESRNIETFVGDRTIEEVINDNIICFGGLNRYIFLGSQRQLNRASLRAVINGLADLTGQTAQILEILPTNIAKLTNEDIAIATSKNWTLA
jgi:surface protein